MPAVGTTNAPEAVEQKKKHKRKKSTPASSSPNAILGGQGVKAADAQAKKTHKQARKRRVRRIKAQTRRLDHQTASTAPPDVASDPDPNNVTTYTPSEADAYTKRIESQTDAFKKASNPTVAAISGVAHPAAEIASVLPIGPGGDAKLGLKGILAGAKALGIKGAEHEAEEQIAKTAVKDAVKTEAKTGEKAAAKRSVRRKADKALEKQSKAERKVSRAVERKNTSAAKKVRDKAGKVWKAKQPAALTKAGRKVIVRTKAHGLNKAGIIAAPTVGAVGAGVATSTGAALVDDPKKTLATTARSIPGFVTAPVKLAAETAEVGKNLATGHDDPLAPLKAEGAAQLDYYKQLAKASEGGEAGKKLIENQLGLTPALTAALGVHSLSRHAAVHPALRDIPEAKFTKGRRVSSLRKEAADASNPDRARRAKKQLQEAERGKHKRRRQVAQTNDTSERLAQAGYHEDIKHKTGKGRNLGKEYKALKNVHLNDRLSLADAVHVLGQHGIPLDAKRGLEALQEVKRSLRDTKQTPSIEARTNREVIDALIQHPDYLEHSALPRFLEGYRHARHDISVKRHEDRVGTERAAGKPDPLDDRARLLPLAREKGIPSPEERPPPELADSIDYAPKKYENANKVIRDKAKQMRKRANGMAKRAQSIRRYDPAKAAQLERKAATLKAEAERQLAVVNRLSRASKLATEAESLKLAGDVEGAKKLRAQALGLRRRHARAEEHKLNEFRSEVGKHIGERHDPIFFHDYKASDAGSPTAGGRHVKTAGLPPKEKMNLGLAREMGLVDTSGHMVMEGIFRDRMNLETGRGFRHLLERTASEKDILTGPEARRQLETGEAPTGHSLFPVQEFKRAYQRGDAEYGLALINDALRGKLAKAEGLDTKGKKYAWIPTSTLKEQYAEMEPLSKTARNLRRFGSVQSRLLLGTSPTWVANQLFATPIILAARHPNPLTWIKAAKLAATDWKKLTPHERAAVNARFGGTVGDTSNLRNSELGPTADNVRSMHDAVKGINRSWMGNALISIAKLDPLIKGVARYEGKLRTLETLMEYDKLHHAPRARKFMSSVSVLHKSVTDNIAHLAKMSDSERLKWIASHPHEQDILGENINSAIGDWSSMTAAEKKASSVLIFYPFLRFSMQWMFHTFPRDNPLKAAVLANLAQQNAQEVEKMVGGTPSFFQSFGLVPFRDQNGDVSGALNLARMAPGSNALVEGLGTGSEINLSTATRLLQPILGASLTALAGQDAFGQPSETPKGLLFLQQILGLNPITRAAALPRVKEQSPVSKLFSNVEGKSPLEKALVPDFTVSKGQSRAAQQISETLDRSSKAPSTTEISNLAKQIVTELDGKPPNPYNLEQIPSAPAIKKLVQRARTSDTASGQIQAMLKQQGLGETPEEEAAFGALYGLVNYTKFHYRSQDDKKRYRRKNGIPDPDAKPNSAWGSGGTSWNTGGSSSWDSGGSGWNTSGSNW